VRGICSPAYANISRRNLQYPAALPRGFFIQRCPKGIKDIAIFLGLVTEEELEAAHVAQTYAENISAVEDAAKKYNQALDKSLITETDIVKQKELQLSALNSFIDALAEQSVLMNGQDEALNGQIAQLVGQRDRLAEMLELSKGSTAEDKEQTRELTRQEKIALEIEAAEKKHENTLRRINEQLIAGRITREEAEQQTHSAMETWADDLRGVVDTYGDIGNAAVSLLASKKL
jgi:chromosome segregation ATPase